MNKIKTLCAIPLAVCTSLVLAGCGKSGGAPQAPPPPQVSVAQVLEKRVKDWDEFTGRLQAIETVEIFKWNIDTAHLEVGADVANDVGELKSQTEPLG